jgi:hypothetical protein
MKHRRLTTSMLCDPTKQYIIRNGGSAIDRETFPRVVTVPGTEAPLSACLHVSIALGAAIMYLMRRILRLALS